uniref:uncharacterized protein LOC122593213 isoform X2 n=1 Tax=Erigeron canadensis TaxID=72917 RepID=UPI001CB919CA|nr:uncharacterized protein LOC122593213 isoform X2 [Erigeron canadensis]
MASIKMLKAGLYPFSGGSQTCFRRNELFGCSDTRIMVKLNSANNMFRVACTIRNGDNSNNQNNEPPESLFMKELKRRGMTPTSLLDENWTTSNEESMYKEDDGNISNRNTVINDLEKSLLNQREQSMALNSEGLEGLIPRANILLRLGGTFFLAFWPLILVNVAFFSAIYLYFGPKFVHDGSTKLIQLPQYIDPYTLLEDEPLSQTSPMLN